MSTIDPRPYREWLAHTRTGYRSAFLKEVVRCVPDGTSVLEIGYGPGTDAAGLAERRRYTGIDVSRVQLEHAERQVPTGTVIYADVLEALFEPGSLHAVVSSSALDHVPRDELFVLSQRVFGWFLPRGWSCASFGTSDNPGTVQRAWLGKADMYFSSLPPSRTDALLARAGFEIEIGETVTEIEEGEGQARSHRVIAQRPGREGTNPR